MAVWHKVGVKLTAKHPDSKEVLWAGVTAEYEKVIRQALTKALNKSISEFASDEFLTIIKGK